MYSTTFPYHKQEQLPSYEDPSPLSKEDLVQWCSGDETLCEENPYRSVLSASDTFTEHSLSAQDESSSDYRPRSQSFDSESEDSFGTSPLWVNYTVTERLKVSIRELDSNLLMAPRKYTKGVEDELRERVNSFYELSKLLESCAKSNDYQERLNLKERLRQLQSDHGPAHASSLYSLSRRVQEIHDFAYCLKAAPRAHSDQDIPYYSLLTRGTTFGTTRHYVKTLVEVLDKVNSEEAKVYVKGRTLLKERPQPIEPLSVSDWEDS